MGGRVWGGLERDSSTASKKRNITELISRVGPVFDQLSARTPIPAATKIRFKIQARSKWRAMVGLPSLGGASLSSADRRSASAATVSRSVGWIAQKRSGSKMSRTTTG